MQVILAKVVLEMLMILTKAILETPLILAKAVLETLVIPVKAPLDANDLRAGSNQTLPGKEERCLGSDFVRTSSAFCDQCP
jgi:hypothetical protein